MPKDTRTIEVGDRFEDMVVDWRSEGRVIQIRDADHLSDRYVAEVEAHPMNPQMVGRKTTLSGRTLRTRYRRISR